MTWALTRADGGTNLVRMSQHAEAQDVHPLDEHAGQAIAPTAEAAIDDWQPHPEEEPEEPSSPMWLPLVGIGLFVIAGIYMLAGADEGKTQAVLEEERKAEIAAAQPPPPPAPPPQPAQPKPPQPPGGKQGG